MKGTDDAKRGDWMIGGQHTRTGAKSDIEEVLHTSPRTKFVLQSCQELEGHDTTNATPIYVEHSYSSGRWFQVHRKVGMRLAKCTGL